jgi:hypothetical protein
VENTLVILLMITNLFAGIGFSVPLSAQFRKIARTSKKRSYFIFALIFIYFIECVAFAFGMATQIFTILLSFPWGYLIGKRLKSALSKKALIRNVINFSLFCCFPTISFCLLIPIMKIFEGANIIDVQQSVNFGIPEFLPFPFNTIIGFCLALLVGTVVLKSTITIWTTFFWFKKLLNN